MTTTIRTGTGGGSGEEGGKPTLVGKVEGFKDTINGAFLLRKDDGVLTVCDDKSVRVWLKRDTGQYWPSIHHLMPSVCTCLDLHEATGRLFVGLANGTISEFTLADDYNSIRHVKDFFSHTSGVTKVAWCVEWEWLVSVGKDKALVWEDSETGRRLGSFTVAGWATALAFDAGAKYAFVGDYSGTVSVLKLGDASADLITKLSAHTGAVRDLAWDAATSRLYSAANDGLVIVWDIGGKKGTALELNRPGNWMETGWVDSSGHRNKVTALALFGSKHRVLSAGDGGSLVAWDMAAKRSETPAWATADTCQICEAPFFWNFRAMWDRKVVGIRQHHCRMCGAAVCWSCSPETLRWPLMGYELPVRVCSKCKATVDGEDADAPASSSQATNNKAKSASDSLDSTGR